MGPVKRILVIAFAIGVAIMVAMLVLPLVVIGIVAGLVLAGAAMLGLFGRPAFAMRGVRRTVYRDERVDERGRPGPGGRVIETSYEVVEDRGER